MHEARQELREAIVDAPAPDPTELFAHVYSEPTPALKRQREQLEDELGG